MSRVFKKNLTPLRKRGQIDVHNGKGAVEQTLPSRSALSTLTAGDPGQRTMNNYSKNTPLMSPNAQTPDIQGLGPDESNG